MALVPCPNCNGTGRNLFPYQEDGLILAKVEDCKVCKGSKEIEDADPLDIHRPE